MSVAGKKATREHRRRIRALGMARVEVQAPASDTQLIRDVAEVLRGDPMRAKRLREAIAAALPADRQRDAFDIFGSDLPDEVFEDVFDQPRSDRWREIEF